MFYHHFSYLPNLTLDYIYIRRGMESQAQFVRMGKFPFDGAFGEEVRSDAHDLLRGLLQDVSKSHSKGEERRGSRYRRQD